MGRSKTGKTDEEPLRINSPGAMLKLAAAARPPRAVPQMIPPETIEQVAAANDIVEVIGASLPLKRAGANFVALCPFHREKSPSFNVSPSRQHFHCFGCGVGGTVFKYVMMHENIEFPAAVRRLAERVGITIVEEHFGKPEERGAGEMRRRLLALHAEAAAWFHRNLMKTPAAEHARNYLKTRGLTGEVAARWQIGYAPESWDSCLRWSAERGFRKEEAIKSGLVKVADDPEATGDPDTRDLRNVRAYDRFRDRLMFPICNESGEVIAFSGRVLTADAKGAKYVNSPETPLFTKGKVLFGLHKAKPALLEAGFAIVCEGQIDLITAYEAGIQNVTAPQGTAFTDQQARLLKRHVEEVVLCFDSDAAGQKAAERSLPALLEANVTVRVATMPPGEDPDSLIRTRGAGAFAERIGAARDFFDFQIERLGAEFDLNSPRGKKQFAARMAESVSLLTDPVMREAVVGKVSALLRISAQDFRPLLKRRGYTGARSGEADLKASESAAEGNALATDAPTFEKPPKTISDLLKISLEDAESRQWLQAQPWEEVLPQIGGSDLLFHSLAAELTPGNAAATNAFMATLPPAEESYVAGLLAEKPYPHPLNATRDCWRGLEKSILRERLAALESRLRLAETGPEETARLQKEILDLHLRLKQVARL